jgi:hypothetical protein
MRIELWFVVFAGLLGQQDIDCFRQILIRFGDFPGLFLGR